MRGRGGALLRGLGSLVALLGILKSGWCVSPCGGPPMFMIVRGECR